MWILVTGWMVGVGLKLRVESEIATLANQVVQVVCALLHLLIVSAQCNINISFVNKHMKEVLWEPFKNILPQKYKRDDEIITRYAALGPFL